MNNLRKAAEAITVIGQNIAAALLAVSLLLIFYQVFTRFILGQAATWTEILTRGLVIWMVFLVAGAGFRFGAMISLSFLFERLPPTVQRVGRWLVTGLVLLCLGLLIWYGTLMAIRVQSQRIAMLDIPMSWFYAAIPVGALFTIPGVLLAHFAPHDDLSGQVAL